MVPDAVFMPLRDLSEQVRTRQISAVDLAETFLDRLDTLGPRLRAVVTVTRDLALQQARQADREIAAGQYRGPLHGIPYGAKDLLATAGGIPTTWGAAPLRHQTFDHDATVIQRLGRAGAVLAAKLAMIELAGGMGYCQPNASFTGACRNPWDVTTWSGGSSSGSGAAVSAGLVPFAIGSETWGSILSPANNCGVAGLRPTYGRVSRHGAMTLSWTLDKLGPLALTADDCGLVLEAIAGPDPHDPTCSTQAYTYETETIRNRRLRLGVIAGITDGIDDAVRTNFEHALEVLNEVASIDSVTLPDLPFEAITRTILFAEAASAFEDFVDSGQVAYLTAPEDRYTPYARTVILATDYLRALRLRAQIARQLDDLLAPFDALVGPTRPLPATPLDQPFRSAVRGTASDLMGAAGKAAGLPAVSVPSGFSPHGLPTGVQFMGRADGENTILTVARIYQRLTDWHHRHPPDPTVAP